MQNLIAALVMSPSYIVGILLAYLPFVNMVSKAQKKRLGLAYFAVYCLNLACLVKAFSLYGISVDVIRNDMPIFGLAVTLVNIVFIPGRTKEHLLASGISLTCNNLLFGLTVFISALLWGAETAISYIYGNFVNVVILLLAYHPLKNLVVNTVKPFLETDPKEYWSGVWIIPLAMFFSMFFTARSVQDIGTIRFVVSRGLIAVVTISACYAISRDHKMVQQKRSMEDQLAMQKSHYVEMERYVQRARKISHDYKHLIAVIQHYIDTDDKEGLQEYCWELSGKQVGGVRIPYTGNNAVDGLLYRYAQLCKEQNVEFSYAGSIGECAMSNMELSVLIGNALENALTGCKTLEENRRIHVVMQSEKEMTSVVVRNTFDGVVQKKGDVLYSRKRDKEPGIGMSSMRSICEKNGAEMNVQWDGDTFTVLFLIPGKKK